MESDLSPALADSKVSTSYATRPPKVTAELGLESESQFLTSPTQTELSKSHSICILIQAVLDNLYMDRPLILSNSDLKFLLHPS